MIDDYEAYIYVRSTYITLYVLGYHTMTYRTMTRVTGKGHLVLFSFEIMSVVRPDIWSQS